MPRCPARLPRFRSRRALAAGWLAACGATGAAIVAATTPPAASVYNRAAPAVVAQSGGDVAPEAQAERIVSGALLALDRADPFAAKLRQKARIGDRVLTGAGRYVQAGVDDDRRFRFESRLECRSESFELTEVCDGLFSWRYQRNATDPPGLSRLDVRRIRERLEELKVSEPRSSARYLGGLQRVLWLIRERFQFTSAEEVDLDGLPAWRVEGRWHPEHLAWFMPELAAAARRPGGIEPSELPDGLPWSVRLWIGRGDLLPRRVEWLAIPGARPVAATAALEPIAVLELLDVEVGGRVDAANFYYKPATTGLMDVTEQTVKSLGPWRP